MALGSGWWGVLDSFTHVSPRVVRRLGGWHSHSGNVVTTQLIWAHCGLVALSGNYLQLMPAGEGEISFVQWRVTGYVNHSAEQAHAQESLASMGPSILRGQAALCRRLPPLPSLCALDELRTL